VEEEICRRMPRKFFSSIQFQRKRKSLVFFQSLNFLWWDLTEWLERLTANAVVATVLKQYWNRTSLLSFNDPSVLQFRSQVSSSRPKSDCKQFFTEKIATLPTW
jgi:hypothetical protein